MVLCAVVVIVSVHRAPLDDCPWSMSLGRLSWVRCQVREVVENSHGITISRLWAHSNCTLGLVGIGWVGQRRRSFQISWIQVCCRWMGFLLSFRSLFSALRWSLNMDDIQILNMVNTLSEQTFCSNPPWGAMRTLLAHNPLGFFGCLRHDLPEICWSNTQTQTSCLKDFGDWICHFDRWRLELTSSIDCVTSYVCFQVLSYFGI